MSNEFDWSKDALVRQYAACKKHNLLKCFISAGNAFNVDPVLLISISSREINFNPYYYDHAGDAGHGHGLMQIDDHSFAAFCSGEEWKDPQLNISKGSSILADNIKQVSKINAPDALKLRMAIAGYNCGTQRAIRALQTNQDVDVHTTGKDYSADVMARYAIFKECFDNDDDKGVA